MELISVLHGVVSIGREIHLSKIFNKFLGKYDDNVDVNEDDLKLHLIDVVFKTELYANNNLGTVTIPCSASSSHI